MSAIAWWLIPIGATLLAVVYVSWAGRARPPADVHDSVEGYQRFRAAMERDAERRAARRSTDETDT
jgi:hypothetical protein